MFYFLIRCNLNKRFHLIKHPPNLNGTNSHRDHRRVNHKLRECQFDNQVLVKLLVAWHQCNSKVLDLCILKEIPIYINNLVSNFSDSLSGTNSPINNKCKGNNHNQEYH